MLAASRRGPGDTLAERSMSTLAIAGERLVGADHLLPQVPLVDVGLGQAGGDANGLVEVCEGLVAVLDQLMQHPRLLEARAVSLLASLEAPSPTSPVCEGPAPHSFPGALYSGCANPRVRGTVHGSGPRYPGFQRCIGQLDTSVPPLIRRPMTPFSPLGSSRLFCGR